MTQTQAAAAFAATCWLERNSSSPRSNSKPMAAITCDRKWRIKTTIITLTSLIISVLLLNQVYATSGSPPSSVAAIQAEQFIVHKLGHNSLSLAGAQFDGSQFKSVYEIIRAHPDLREFANLCEAQGVREIAQMDKTALTMFAPIDKSLVDLLARSQKTRTLNLIELAKHHIAQGLVMPEDNTKYPVQFQSVALVSPLYLNQVTLPVQGGGTSAQLFVNNAKILATYLIQIDDNQYQALHLIDTPLEFAYVNRRTQLRSQPVAPSSGNGPQTATLSAAAAAASSSSSSSISSGSSSNSLALGSSTGSARYATVKRPLHLEDLLEPRTSEAGEMASAAVGDFYERFGGVDLVAHQPQVDLYRTRVRTNQPTIVRSLAYDQAKLARLFKFDTNQAQRLLYGKLHHLNESSTSSLNTYFLPVNSDELEQLVVDSPSQLALNSLLTLQAHIIPGQVLFTRAMSLGQLHTTLFNSNQPISGEQSQLISLSLAKTLPENLFAERQLNNSTSGYGIQDQDQQTQISRRLLTTPLILQAKCTGSGGGSGTGSGFRNGLTSSEILLANIPISNGVLHLIKRPLVAQSNSLLDYINDNEHQLSDIVHALGSQSGRSSLDTTGSSSTETGSSLEGQSLNRFRELLARGDRQLLSTFSVDFVHANRTIFAPTDEAFTKLRYDLRALIIGDESLIPTHWNPTYRQDLLERLLKRHIVPDQTLTSDLITSGLNHQSNSMINLNGQLVSFKKITNNDDDQENGAESKPEVSYKIECDATQAQLIQRDLIGNNGVLHLIDRVLGEEQETIYSLLQSIVLRATAKLAPEQNGDTSGDHSNGLIGELSALVELNLRQQSKLLPPPEQSIDSSVVHEELTGTGTGSQQQQVDQKRLHEPELALISKTIESYLNEMSTNKRAVLQGSANISFQLARLVSRAESRDDWNEKFKLIEKSFTYFVPNDLAWLRLQQLQPELYKPLMLFLLDQQQPQLPAEQLLDLHSTSPSSESVVGSEQQFGVTSGAGVKPRGASESSHRLLQILERHLIGNKKLAARDLNHLGAIQTVGATLRLVDQRAPSSMVVNNQQQQLSADGQPMSAFAALHSIISGGGGSSTSSGSSSSSAAAAADRAAQMAASHINKALRYSTSQANFVQVHETSNGYLYLIDAVLLAPEDADHLIQTSATPAISSTMSSLLGAHNSAILDLLHQMFNSSTSAISSHLMLTLIGTLTMAIIMLALVALVLVARRRRISKMNRHQQLESGLTSSSSASNSGSTSTTKSL